MAEGSVYFGAVAGSYASGLCFAKFGYQVAWQWWHPTTQQEKIVLCSDRFLCVLWTK